LSITATPTGPTAGTWRAFAAITDTAISYKQQYYPGQQIIGIAAFDIDIVGGGGANVTSSLNESPSAYFWLFPDNGTNGIAVHASQYTFIPSLVLVDVGLAPDGITPLPFLLASGTYTHPIGAGSLTVSQETTGLPPPDDSGFNLLIGPRGGPFSDASAVEGAHLVIPGSVSFAGGEQPVPEPLTMAGILLGCGGLAAYVRRRRLA
jgi:hypothetical protein